MHPLLDLDQRASVLSQFDHMFELMLGIGAQDLAKDANPFAQSTLANINGGLGRGNLLEPGRVVA